MSRPKEQKATRPSSVAGISMPSARADFRLMAGPRPLDVSVGSKLRNTQNEQMSSALPPRTDFGLASPNVTRIERHGKFDDRPLCARSGRSISMLVQ